MNRVFKCALAVTLAATSTVALSADVKTRDKTQFKLEGMLGRVAGMFGGKAAREGAEATNAVKGHRKIELGESTGRIIDHVPPPQPSPGAALAGELRPPVLVRRNDAPEG